MVANVLLKPSLQFSNISATTAAFTLGGGLYGITVIATFGGGNVVPQRLGPDGTTWISVMTALTTAGYTTVSLPPGTYRLALTTATAVYASISAI
jgi:hypothetical protein